MLTFSIFNITENSYSHFSRGSENGRFAPGWDKTPAPGWDKMPAPGRYVLISLIYVISLLISHYQSDGIIGTLLK